MVPPMTTTNVVNDDPVVATLPASQAPPAPPGLVANYYLGPDGGQSNTAPVIQWQGYTYWIYGKFDSDWYMYVLAFDQAGQMVRRVDKSGARYPWRIIVNPEDQTITLYGQAWKTIVCTWAELQV